MQHIFAGNPLDRADAQRRDADWLQQAMRSADARFLPLHKLQVPLRQTNASTAETAELHWLSHAELAALKTTEPSAADPTAEELSILLGLDNGAPRFAHALAAEETTDTLAFTDCRRAAMQLSPSEAGIVAQARSQIDWHLRNRYCGSCGEPSHLERGGQIRCCDQCNAQIFPRTDPVVIMLITHKDRCLLGKPAQLPANMNFYSALAGFIDQGESIEEAVRREVFEEAGVRVGGVSYHSSQPWPFPASLMIGCVGEALTDQIQIDPREMADAAWFTKEQIRSAFAGEQDYQMPGPIAIAHHLIMHWFNAND